MTNHAATMLGMLLAAGTALARQTEGAGRRGSSVRVYVGTYTDGESKGIYRLRLDLATGALSPEGEPTPSVNPSFLALHPSGRFLYAVNEVGQARGDQGGAVSAFAVDPASGDLTFLNQQPSGGAAPCHITIDKAGRNLLVANYWGGSVAVLPIRPDGRLSAATILVRHEGRSVDAERQEAPHAHSINLDPDNRFALAADLGLDKLLVYRFDAAPGMLVPHQPSAATLAPGAGPRHLAFHPQGRHGYVINELSSTVTAFAYDAAAGTLNERQTVSTLPAGFTGKNLTAEVAVHPDGRFLYGSNRGHDSIAIFTIDAATGQLTPAGHQPSLGQWPRHFVIDPTGAYLLAANQQSDSIAVFRLHRASGGLQPMGVPYRLPRPVCLRMMPAVDGRPAARSR